MIKVGSKDDGDGMAILVLEPGNLRKLREGQPIAVKLRDFIPSAVEDVQLLITYTPDIEFVARYMQERPLSAEMLCAAIDAAKSRPEVDRGK